MKLNIRPIFPKKISVQGTDVTLDSVYAAMSISISQYNVASATFYYYSSKEWFDRGVSVATDLAVPILEIALEPGEENEAVALLMLASVTHFMSYGYEAEPAI